MPQLTSLRLSGWKSIRNATVELRPLNVLVGANGAGKSNLVSFFALMNALIDHRVQVYVGTTGGADVLLHYGPKQTTALEANFGFATEQGQARYSVRLIPGAGNALLFEHERVGLEDRQVRSASSFRIVGGNRETSLDGDDANPDVTEKSIYRWLTRCQVYHFHDTSLLGPMRRDCPLDANRQLASDAANLPAMLYLYRERYRPAYNRIVAAVRAVAPFFDDFILEPLRLNPRNLALHWRARDSAYEFGSHQLSDGTLRAIALFTLLLQPEADLPQFIVLDEPELGLHPAALAVLADLLKSTARHSQLLVATQSATLLDHFEPEDILTVKLRDGCSTFERLDSDRLKDWLDEYTLSALWERNVIGGGPY